MFKFKYYDAIKEAQRKTRAAHQDAPGAFELNNLGADSLRRRFKLWARDGLFRIGFFLLRALRPNLKLGRLVIVSRDEDVRKVLDNPDAFEVPYGLEMRELGGADFVLGLEDKPHTDQRRIISSVMLPQDAALIGELSAKFAKALIRSSGGRIDVMKDLITRVSTETCIRYFGLTVHDPDSFAEWTMSVSALLFADPFGDEKTRQLALNGAARIRAVIDRSIVRQRQYLRPDDETVLGRLLDLQTTQPQLTDDRIRAILVGLVTGFIPTTTLAAGKILQQLLRRADTFEEAKTAALKAGDDRTKSTGRKELQRLLFEAARLNPALAPGQWRYARATATLADGKWRAMTIKKGSVLMVSTMSALRDSRRVRNSRNKPAAADQQWPDIELMFGCGIHSCLGTHIAMAQITEIFGVLLSQQHLRVRRAFGFPSAIHWVGPFPRRFDMEFEPASPSTQSMITICAPLEFAGAASTIRNMIKGYGNPSKQPLKALLDNAGVVHFASLSVIDVNVKGGDEPAPFVLLELNVDGSPQCAIAEIARIAGKYLLPIFEHTPAGRRGAALEKILREYALDLKTVPWGNIGLNYMGTQHFQVPDIEKQASLAAFTRDVLDYFLGPNLRFGNRAMQALGFVRMFIEQDKMLTATPSPKVSALLERGKAFSDCLTIPSRKPLAISKWKDPGKISMIGALLKSRSGLIVFAPAYLFLIGMGVVFFRTSASMFPSAPFPHVWWFFGPGLRFLLAAVEAAGATALVLVLIALIFKWVLNYHEKRDVPDRRNPKSADIEAIAEVENPEGFVQNHFMSVSLLKPGRFRKLTLALSLWGIKQLIALFYRPGFVLNMGTIHYARWFRPAGTKNLIFLSNFDGSWESYLEDFIMKAHEGQTAAWCNGVGFPRTKNLIQEGAQNGDEFKRWVRLQQVPAQFWYSRFPKLTTDHIRTNALIHDGLARARTDTDARAWLDCLGSMPRPDYTIETDEVQSLVFRALGALPYSVCGLFQFSEQPDPGAVARWLDRLVPGSLAPNLVRSTQQENRLEVTFGDRPFRDAPAETTLGTFVAFTAAGLKKLRMPGPECSDGLGSFQGAFNIGMANRGRVLGDGSSGNWRWSDSDTNRPEEGPRAADVAVIIYGKSLAHCRDALAQHQRTLGTAGRLVHCIDTEPVPTPSKASELERLEFEHFGFRDGISQPIIRGTQRFAKGALERDIVEPGEFIFGYRNNQDYYPPTPIVRIDSDLADCLPMSPKKPSRFPVFGHRHRPVRDFGQNGTYLVIRELAQDVEGFRKFTKAKATELARDYSKLADVAGGTITPEWIAAKMMGRWQDGTPLVERAGGDRGEGVRKHSDRENDFSYALDDPQGIRCPFGSHVRRANPRDSLQPDDPAQQSIINRHRLLRRGRAYQYQPAPGAAAEKGLLFVALCTDLERQFEFVQQTWLNSPVFHGLKDEPDPIVTGANPETGKFTIPTPSGPVTLRDMQSFVSVKSGGYFFLPSRSAIRYLANLNASKWSSDGSTYISASSTEYREHVMATCNGIQSFTPQAHADAID